MTKETLEKIKKLKLWGMARTYETSLENEKMLALSADELIGMLVEAEWDDRQNRNLERRLRNARFRYQSSIESIDYQSDRNLDRGQLLRFAECGFITKHENIIITGSTGIGKSYIATALGHQACTLGFKVYYANLGKLFSRLKMGKADGSYLKEISKIERQDLLIIDDFGLAAMTQAQAEDFYEIISERHLNSSLVITSNRPPQDWISLFPDPVMANSALDRLSHHAHHLIMEGESYRKKLKPKTSNPSKPKGAN